MENKLQHTNDEPSRLPYRLIKHITNDFDKKRILGSGGFGTVYKGVYENGEEIAVKLLHNISGVFDDSEFQKEFNNLRGLKHHNIVELVGFCNEFEEELAEFEGRQVTAVRVRTALCFEYVHNGSLNRHISDEYTGFNWHTRYRIIKGISDGLKYLREGLESPIMHFDLKPDNILLDKHMTPKIADFGLSKLFGEENTKRTISSVGTCGYWPPEYIKHQIISREFDIFSLGVIIVKIMTGHEGYNSIVEMTTRKSVKLVHESWRRRLRGTLSHMQLEVYCNQVKRCIEIALDCLKSNRQERPTIHDIVSSLNETERIIGDLGMQKEQGTILEFESTSDLYWDKLLAIAAALGAEDDLVLQSRRKQFYQENGESSVPSEISNITVDCGPSSENFPPVEPRAMPFQLLKNITNNFSRKRLFDRSYGRTFKGVFEDGKVIVVRELHALGVLEENEMHEIVNHVKVHHQNIVQLVGYCWEKEETVVPCNEKYIYASKIHTAMCFEYLPNGSLDQYISGISSGLDWGTRYAIIKGICEGLKCLHEGSKNSRIHMNLKLKNILLDENMTAKINVFDIGRFVGKGKRSIDDVLPCSSDRHMPPEFIQRQIITKAFDIYSLGIIFIELVTGTRVGFRDTNFLEISSAVIVEQAHEEWMQRLQKTVQATSVEGYCQQVKKCLEIGLQCVERDRHRRPTITNIVDTLNETEINCGLLVVHPQELQFLPFRTNKKAMISCTLELNNRGDDRVAFMLVANRPKMYLTKKPLCGIVPPRCAYSLTLTMMPNKIMELSSKKKIMGPPSSSSDCSDFFTLYSVVLGQYDLQDVQKDSVLVQYDNFFKKAKDKATGDEVQEVKLKVLCHRQEYLVPPQKKQKKQASHGTSSEIIATPDAQQVSFIDVHPTEPWFMTTNHMGSLRLWNYYESMDRMQVEALNYFQLAAYEPVHVATFIAREKWIVAGDRNGDIHVYNYDQNQHVKSFDAHNSCITTLFVHPTDPFLLSSSEDDDHLIKLWSWNKDWKCTRTFQGHTDRVTEVAFNPMETDSFASTSWDGTVKIWSICSDDPRNIITLKLDGSVERLLCIDYFTRYNQQHLIVGCKDMTVQIWKLGMKECVDKLEGHADHISAVKLHPDLPVLITGSIDGTIRIWNSTTYKLENIIGFNLGAVYALGCIKGSQRIVAGCHQGIAMMKLSLP